MSTAEAGFSRLLWRVGLTGALLGATGTVYFFVGLAGQVSNPTPNLLVAVALIGAAVFFLREFLGALKPSSLTARVLWVSIAAIIISETLLSLVPPTARDELTHHLSIPRLYAGAGRIIEVPMAPYSYYPMLLDMLYTPWIVWRIDSLPKIVHALFGYLTGLLLYAYLSRRMNEVYGLLGFFFWISIPAVLRLSHWAYVDLGITYYSTAALLCLLRWSEEKSAIAWLWLAGVSAGFAVATKPNGLVALLLLTLCLVWLVVTAPQQILRKSILQLSVFGIAAALPFLPWLAKNWHQTGNPFFPLLGGLFAAKGPAVEAPAEYVALSLLARREFLYGESWWQIAALPLRLFFFGQDDNPQYFDGVLSPILILLLPWAFKGKWIEEKRVLFAYSVMFLLYAMFLVDLRVRYVLLIVPPLVILLIFGVFNIYLRIKSPAYLMVLLLLFAGYQAFYLYRYFQEVRPLSYLLGRESRSAYLLRVLPEYETFQFVNRELPGTAKIYLLFVGRRGYYCEREYFHDGGELPALLMSAMRSAANPAQIEMRLRREGITHLMIRTDLLARYLVNNLAMDRIALWNQFAANHLSLAFQARGYVLYKLHG
jgi:Dolichyl-phosphate-mannose-protein mannosyltransferase